MEELKAWVESGYLDAAGHYLPKSPEQWWPAMGKNGQGSVTTWAWAIVLQAACARFAGQSLSFHAPFHGEKHLSIRQGLMGRLWTNESLRSHAEFEIGLDFSVHKLGPDVCGALLTAESEVFALHGTGWNIMEDNGYAWDFYKLLQVSSPLRLFVARVGASDDALGGKRRDELVTSLQRLVTSCREMLLRRTDELGIVVIPECGRNEEWRDLRLVTVNDDAWEHSRPWA